MGLESLKTCNDLQQELEEAKVTLVNLNDNIRRIVGRSQHARIDRNEKHKLYETNKRVDSVRPSYRANDGPKPKRRQYDSKSVFQRLSGNIKKESNEEEVGTPRLNSRVIRELPTRQEIVAVQCADSESRARNRRMFGCLLGTLHKFTQEETKLKKKEEQKAQIEKRLEEQEMLERESIKKQRDNLFLDRKRKQLEIKKLEIKVSRLKDFETWKASMIYLKDFIKTKTEQPIYYKPKILNKTTEKLLKENRNEIDVMVEKRFNALNKELLELESSLKLNDLDLDDKNELDQSSDKFDSLFLDGHKGLDDQDDQADIEDNADDTPAELPKLRRISEPALSSSVVVIKPTKDSNIND